MFYQRNSSMEESYAKILENHKCFVRCNFGECASKWFGNVPRSCNGYPLQCHYPGRKIASGYRWKPGHIVYIRTR